MNDVNSPIMQIRESADGTWSVIARVWNPQKKFFEHPKYINLTKGEAEKRCQELIKNPPSVDTIVKTWVFIGS